MQSLKTLTSQDPASVVVVVAVAADVGAKDTQCHG